MRLTDSPESSPEQTLLIARTLWGSLFGGQALFGGMVVWLVVTGRSSGTPSLYPVLMYVALAALVGLTPVAYFLRNQIYKSNWREHAVAPPGYVAGNLILMALLAMPGFIAFLAVLVSGALMPMMLIGAAALAVQLVNFPTGAPMRPCEPAIAGRQDMVNS